MTRSGKALISLADTRSATSTRAVYAVFICAAWAITPAGTTGPDDDGASTRSELAID